MSVKKYHTISISLLLLIAQNLCAQWKQTNGPFGGSISSIIADSNILLAGGRFAGVYVSTDDAATWKIKDTTLFRQGVNCFAKSGSRLIAGADKVFFSKDRGQSWSTIDSGFTNAAVTCLAVRSDAVFAGTADGVYMLREGRNRWVRIDSNFNQENIVAVGLIDSCIFVSTIYNGLYFSRDDGKTWVFKNNGLGQLRIVHYAFIDSSIFIATNGGLFQSLDNGDNWTLLSKGLPEKFSPRVLAIKGTKFFASANFDGIYRSADSGRNWKQVINGMPDLDAITSFAFKGNDMYVGCGIVAGVFKSQNEGENWESASEGMNRLEIMAITSKDSLLMVATRSSGVFVSVDGGNRWTSRNNGFRNSQIHDFCIQDNTIYVTTGKGAFKSNNYGGLWTPVFTDTFTEAIAVRDSMIVIGSLNGGCYISKNAGQSFSEIKIAATSAAFISVLISGQDLLVGDAWGKGVFHSDDDGLNWSPVNKGLSNPSVWALKKNDSTVWMASGGIYKSEDMGLNWTFCSKDIPGSDYITDFAFYRSVVFASSLGGGIYASGNHGVNWKPVNDGLSEFRFQGIAVHGGFLYAGSDHGVYKRPLSEMTGIKKIGVPHDEIVVYPNPADHVIYTNAGKEVLYTLTDITGHIIKSGKGDSISAEDLAQGIYILELRNGMTYSIARVSVVHP